MGLGDKTIEKDGKEVAGHHNVPVHSHLHSREDGERIAEGIHRQQRHIPQAHRKNGEDIPALGDTQEVGPAFARNFHHKVLLAGEDTKNTSFHTRAEVEAHHTDDHGPCAANSVDGHQGPWKKEEQRTFVVVVE